VNSLAIKGRRRTCLAEKSNDNMSDINLETVAWNDEFFTRNITPEQLEVLTARLNRESQQNIDQNNEHEKRLIELEIKTRQLNENRAKFAEFKLLHEQEMRRNGLQKI
jgi:hypothetical protein